MLRGKVLEKNDENLNAFRNFLNLRKSEMAVLPVALLLIRSIILEN